MIVVGLMFLCLVVYCCFLLLLRLCDVRFGRSLCVVGCDLACVELLCLLCVEVVLCLFGLCYGIVV